MIPNSKPLSQSFKIASPFLAPNPHEINPKFNIKTLLDLCISNPQSLRRPHRVFPWAVFLPGGAGGKQAHEGVLCPSEIRLLRGRCFFSGVYCSNTRKPCHHCRRHSSSFTSKLYTDEQEVELLTPSCVPTRWGVEWGENGKEKWGEL